MLTDTKYERKEMDASDLVELLLYDLIFSTFSESDHVFVVAYALLYGIHYIIMISAKPGDIPPHCMKGLGAFLSCG